MKNQWGAGSAKTPHAWVLWVASVGALAIAAGCGPDIEENIIADCFHTEAELGLLAPAETQESLVDCTVHSDTGYVSGSPFSIDVVVVDDKPVEVDTGNAYWVMKQAAAADGVNLWIVSGFRTMSQQQYLYGCYVNCNCNNCNLAATPGYSNHQSGHALDLNTSAPGVLNWLNGHAAAYGFSRTVPSEPWHWEWWGGGPGGGICGVIDPQCNGNAWLNTCDGSVVKKCYAGVYEEGDCGAFGGTCSTLGGDAHCVQFYCLEHGENSQWCLDGTNIASCNLGSYSEGDCGVFGATCSDAGGEGHCVHPFCQATGENSTFCTDETHIATCDYGSYSEGDCGAFGAVCSEEGGQAHCASVFCLETGENSTFCTDETHIATCNDGQYSEGDCGAFGAVCSEEGGQAHCASAFCLETGENSTFCTDETHIATCDGGNYSEGDCAAYGGTCTESGGTAHCAHFTCLSVIGGENGAACDENGQLLSCTDGYLETSDCTAFGGACSSEGTAHCVHPYCANVLGGENGTACLEDGQQLTCTDGEAEITPCADDETCDPGTGACPSPVEPEPDAVGGPLPEPEAEPESEPDVAVEPEAQPEPEPQPEPVVEPEAEPESNAEPEPSVITVPGDADDDDTGPLGCSQTGSRPDAAVILLGAVAAGWARRRRRARRAS